ncbi:hypothetical protein HDU81_003843 [Chytriomyces hyalinus]|nr:hypothetical protein HDU81_003843 [Chytriomyces hyalinus]
MGGKSKNKNKNKRKQAQKISSNASTPTSSHPTAAAAVAAVAVQTPIQPVVITTTPAVPAPAPLLPTVENSTSESEEEDEEEIKQATPVEDEEDESEVEESESESIEIEQEFESESESIDVDEEEEDLESGLSEDIDVGDADSVESDGEEEEEEEEEGEEEEEAEEDEEDEEEDEEDEDEEDEDEVDELASSIHGQLTAGSGVDDNELGSESDEDEIEESDEDEDASEDESEDQELGQEASVDIDESEVDELDASESEGEESDEENVINPSAAEILSIDDSDVEMADEDNSDADNDGSSSEAGFESEEDDDEEEEVDHLDETKTVDEGEVKAIAAPLENQQVNDDESSDDEDELAEQTEEMTEADIIASHTALLSLNETDSISITEAPADGIPASSVENYASQVKTLSSRLSSVELSTLAVDLSERALSPVREAYSRDPSPVRASFEAYEAACSEVEEKDEADEFSKPETNDEQHVPAEPEIEETPLILPYFDAQTWISIMFLLQDERDIVLLGSANAAIRRLILDPSVVASWLLRRSTHYLCLYNTYKFFPHLLTPLVAQTLISQGAHIPRHLPSLIAQENPHIVDRSQSSEKTALTDALDLLVWTGKTTYGDMFGFDAETAVNATLVPGQEAPEVINAKISQYRKVLAWAYKGVVAQRMEAAGQNYDEDKKARKAVMKTVTDGDAFLYLLQLYRESFEVEDKVVVEVPQPVGRGRFVRLEDKKVMLSDNNISEQEKQRNKIAAALRELSNIYRFAPGLVAERLEMGWLPVDLFERDVELAWFLLRHAGEARSRVISDFISVDDITYKTLLGYRVHVNANVSTLPGSITDVIPFAAINRLIVQGNIVLSDAVLLRMLSDYTNQSTVDRLSRFVPRARITQVGEYLLKECFQNPMLEKAINSGYISKPIQRADVLVKIFNLDKDAISRAFMGTPKDWDNYTPPPALQTTSTAVKHQIPAINKDDGLYQLDLGMLTRPAQSVGSLPWVFWQWVVERVGAKHPVSSACLHDVTVRTFLDQAPLNPGSHEHLSFPRKEADASVKALLALGVPASIGTMATAVRKALYEVEVAALSGEAAAAMKVQAASLKGKKGRMAAAVAEAASLAGANAISRRYIYVLMDVEKRLLSMSAGADENHAKGTVSLDKDTASISSMGGKTSVSSNPPVSSPLDTNLMVEALIETQDGSGFTVERKTVPLYPAALLNQSRAIWLAAVQALVTSNPTWKGLVDNPNTPNSCRRFCIAAANIVRGLEQFGNAASALAVLKSRKGNSKSVKSMSNLDSAATMFFGLWVKEIEAEDAEKEKVKRGLQ